MCARTRGILEERFWHVFQRLALHLLRLFPQAPMARALIAERLTNHQRFETRDLRHEYVLLGRDHFGALSTDEQAIILDWIAIGPDLQHMKVMAEGTLGRVPTEEELDRYARLWRRDRLAWFFPGLPPVWQRHYTELVATVGEPEHPEFSVYLTGGAYTPTSPKSVEDVQGMQVEEIVAFLHAWPPSGDRVAGSPEGLGQILAGVVAAAPERFAAEANCFQALDPTYVRALLTGLHQAVKHQRGFSWTPVLALCYWVSQQPRESLAPDSAFLFCDGGWDWTRTTILDLLLDGLKSMQAAIPWHLRLAVWDILQALADDPATTLEHNAQNAEADAAPPTLSVNTTRGKALEAVLAYARWVQQQGMQEAACEEHTSRSFAALPEVRALLDRHLDSSHHPSVSSCALYGMRFPQLFVLDRAWTTARIAKIFPTEATWRTARDAAWENYVIHWPPYDDIFEMLYDEYSHAIDSLGAPPPPWHRAADPEEALARHLMSFYLRGQIALEDPQGLLTRFYAKATDPLCAYALEVIGRGLGQQPTEVPPEDLERLQTLWEWRLAVARASTPAHHAKELAAFGWWFTSAKFDPVWAMAQLTETLRLVGKAQLEHLVIQRLATLAPEMPLQTIECVRLLCEGDKEGWMIQTWDESIRTVVMAGMQSTEVSAQEAAVALINILSTRGHLSFRDLLVSEQNPDEVMASE